ncbi:N-6 DNA methylase, partial [Candidatus Woesearchaeota archaeon]|nr:N-6 DNA methylase [Candidatus Woesearchaeota archaeon]
MADKEKAKEELRKLIQRYQEKKDEITNEQQVCDSLIRPLFRDVLGWDTENPSEFKSQYSQRGKRSDYVVFLNGISQFVIEAKALDREIKQTYEDYEQAINYARNKEKDFAILTNFRQVVVLRTDTEALPLQCEVRTISIEKAAEKEEDFSVIWNFQKDVWSAEKGDALYKLKPGKKVEPVSKRFVEDMRKWRSALLTNIGKHSRLNDFADFDKECQYIEQEIQRFIDRLVFICYCEDKELKERELKSALEEKEGGHSGKEGFLLNKVTELFKDYRLKYDSDLFFEQGYCDRFRFEDSVLGEIIRDLRKPSKKLPYNFADIEADVLGKAYENFIGHIITGKKRFGEKESLSKRKEEGVYYTPQYIVNYLVDNTLRAHIKEKGISSFDDLLKIKVLDPACGSGSFLIRAFEVMEEEARRIIGKELGYDEKVKLITNCIFGVDKDERAVDITKLRLSLALAARQKLPELGNNIKCGDSLIDD